MSEQVIHTTDDTFEADVVNSERPVLLDFWAEWCGPCKMISPIFEQLAGSHGASVAFAKCDVDEQAETAMAAGISSMPTFFFLRDGEVSQQFSGADPRKLEALVHSMARGK